MWKKGISIVQKGKRNKTEEVVIIKIIFFEHIAKCTCSSYLSSIHQI